MRRHTNEEIVTTLFLVDERVMNQWKVELVRTM